MRRCYRSVSYGIHLDRVETQSEIRREGYYYFIGELEGRMFALMKEERFESERGGEGGNDSTWKSWIRILGI